MKKIFILLIVLSLCIGSAFCEAPTEWDLVPFDIILDCGIITPAQMGLIEEFIANESFLMTSGNWQPSDEMNELLHFVLHESIEYGCSDEALLAEICTWELLVVGIISVEQMSQMNAIIEFHNP